MDKYYEIVTLRIFLLFEQSVVPLRDYLDISDKTTWKSDVCAINGMIDCLFHMELMKCVSERVRYAD